MSHPESHKSGQLPMHERPRRVADVGMPVVCLCGWGGGSVQGASEPACRRLTWEGQAVSPHQPGALAGPVRQDSRQGTGV